MWEDQLESMTKQSENEMDSLLVMQWDDRLVLWTDYQMEIMLEN